MLSAAIRLPGVSASSAAARRFAAAQLRRWNYKEPLGDIMIIVTELVNNAIQHTTGYVRIRMALNLPCLRLEVGDDSPAIPVPRTSGRGGGFGMNLIATLCSRWGVETTSTGKTVWCEYLPLPTVTR